MPGRRGKPRGVGPSFGSTSRPPWSSGSPPASRFDTRATRSTSAVSPTKRTAAPPGRTSARHHSAATGGGASAFAAATPNESGSCSSARPQTTRAFGGAHRSRKSHFRRSASSSVISRSGSETASGMPGEPVPEPTSTIAPSNRSTSGTARSASSRRIRRASYNERSAVSPRSATTASSQLSSRLDDDVAVRLRALGERLDAVVVGEAQVHDLPLDRRHRLEFDPVEVSQRTLRAPHGKLLERLAAPLAVARGVHDDLLASVAVLAMRNRVQQVLHGVDGLAVATDEKAELAPGHRRRDGVVGLDGVDPAANAHCADDSLDERANVGCELALVVSGGARGRRLYESI